MKAGWSALPNIIIEKQASLGLSPLDMNIILHLVHYWWRVDNPPHPTVKTIAAALGVTERTVQKHVRGLEKAKFLRREERRKTKNGSVSNLYHLDGLVAAAKPFADEKIAEVGRIVTAKAERIARKRPKLVVDNDKK